MSRITLIGAGAIGCAIGNSMSEDRSAGREMEWNARNAAKKD